MNIETGKIEMEVEVPLYTAYYTYANRIVIDKDLLCCHTNNFVFFVDLFSRKVFNTIKLSKTKFVTIHKRWCFFNGLLVSILDGFVHYFRVFDYQQQITDEEFVFREIDVLYPLKFVEINFCKGFFFLIFLIFFFFLFILF